MLRFFGVLTAHHSAAYTHIFLLSQIYLDKDRNCLNLNENLFFTHIICICVNISLQFFFLHDFYFKCCMENIKKRALEAKQIRPNRTNNKKYEQ